MMRLKEARKASGMTQRDVADQTGIPLGTLRRWEQGVNEPDTDYLVMLANLYGVSTDTILGSRFAQKIEVQQLSDEEKELINILRNLDKNTRVELMTFARMLNNIEVRRREYIERKSEAEENK